MRDPEDITINLQVYGWEERVEIYDMFLAFLDICDLKGLEPDSAVIDQGGKQRLLKFKTAKERILKKGVYDIRSVQIFRSYSGDPKNEWFWKSNIEIEQTSKGFRWIEIGVIEEEKSIQEYFIPIIRMLLKIITPKYGMCFHFPLKYDPSMYSTGIIYNRLPEPDAQRLEDWGNEGFRKRKYLAGLFRDVYEVNILSKPHMENVIEGKRFYDWVGNHGFGTIEELKPGVWCWTVPKECRDNVRETMMAEGLLIVTI